MRFIASLRFALNDSYLFLKKGVVGGAASNHPLHLFISLNACHSERSEESHNINQTVLILRYKNVLLFDYFVLLCSLAIITNKNN